MLEDEEEVGGTSSVVVEVLFPAISVSFLSSCTSRIVGFGVAVVVVVVVVVAALAQYTLNPSINGSGAPKAGFSLSVVLEHESTT